MNENDLRVRKTEEAIRSAFVSLVAEEGFDAVTVQQILERARVNRSTFYRHYADKYALAGALIDEQVAKVQAVTSDRFSGNQTRENLMSALNALYADFHDNRTELRTLMTIRAEGHDLRAQIERVLRGCFYLYAAEELPAGSDVRFQARVFSGMAMIVLEDMLERDEPRTFADAINEIRSYVAFIAHAGLVGETGPCQ